MKTIPRNSMERGVYAASTSNAKRLLNVSASSSLKRAEARAPFRSLRLVFLIAFKEFSDRFRSGWVIACVSVWLGAIGLTSLFGLVQIGQIGVQGYERTVISLLNLVQYLIPLLGLLLGHDLLVSEREERTLPLLLSTGVGRARLLLGKFFGGCLTLAVPLLLGFSIAGTAIGFAAKDSAFQPFLTLAISGLVLGLIFLGIGLLISTFCRTRVQSLVVALLTWCLAVFVFDLVALGVLISTKASVAAQEIEVICDTTHINASADLHSAFDDAPERESASLTNSKNTSLSWLMINPINLFRAVNLPAQTGIHISALAMIFAVTFWLGASISLSIWKLRRLDL